MGLKRKIAVILMGIMAAMTLTGCTNDAYVQFKPRVGDSYELTYDNSIDYVVKNKKVFDISLNLGGKYNIISTDDNKIKSSLKVNKFSSQLNKDNKEIYRISKTSYDTINVYKQITGIQSNIELNKEGDFIACTVDNNDAINQYIDVEEVANYFAGIMNSFNKVTLVEGVEFDNSSAMMNKEISEDLSTVGLTNNNLMFKEKVESVTSNWATVTFQASKKVDNSDMNIDVTFIVDVRTGVCTQCDWKLTFDRVQIAQLSKGEYGTLTIKSSTKFI